MHGMRMIRLVAENGEKIVEYAAVAHPAVGERVRYKDNFLEALSVLHALKSYRDGNGTTYSLDVVIIKCKQELPY